MNFNGVFCPLNVREKTFQDSMRFGEKTVLRAIVNFDMPVLRTVINRIIQI